MTLQTLVSILENYVPDTESEKVTRLQMLHLARDVPGCLHRKTFSPGHFTASAFVATPDFQEVLLIHHPFLRIWNQPGGHADDDPDLLRGAQREVEEELGLSSSRYHLWGEGRIFDISCQCVPPRPQRNEPEHVHFDVRYLFLLPKQDIVSPEKIETRWLSVQEGLQMFPRDGGRWRVFNKLRSLQ